MIASLGHREACCSCVCRKKPVTKIKIDGNELYEFQDFDQTFAEGYFAFQQHDPGSTVNIRNVEVMELP